MIRLSARLWGAGTLGLLAAAVPVPATFDCAYRQLALDYAQTLQPWRSQSLLQGAADALNGAIEGQNCNVAPRSSSAVASTARFQYRTLPATDAPAVYYVDPAAGSDSNDGSLTAPFLTIGRGLAATRAAPPPGTLVLRAGTFYLPAPLQLGAADSGLTIQAYPGEEAWLSGGRLLTGVAWAPYNVTPGSAWSAPFANTNAVYAAQPGPHIFINGTYASAVLCEAACKANATAAAAGQGCNVWTWHDAAQGSYALECYFRNDAVWSPRPESGHTSGYAVPPKNVWVASLAAQSVAAVPGVRHADGSRATRARFPNGAPETDGFSSSLYARDWLCAGCGANNLQPDYQYTVSSITRNTTAAGWFQHPQFGVGGHCAVFEPPAGYWCGNSTMGGGAFTYRVPYAMVVDASVLPHLPYANATGAIVQTWRPGHWASWMLEVSNVTGDPTGTTGNATFSFSRGGFQGGRGANEGGEISVENVLEELDAPDEWFFDAPTQRLFWFANATAGTPPPASFVVTSLESLLRIEGTQAAPVTNVTVAGVGLRDTAYTYMQPHSMPSGGDWALRRDGVVFLEGTESASLDGCVLERLDGNAVVISGYNRWTAVTRNEFAWVGDTAIASWGKTTAADATFRALAPGMGEDGTAGEQPRFNNVSFNWVHELGINEKQSSFYFQAKTCLNHIEGNVAFNGPRAGVNFNDGFGGGSNLTRNVIFNMCRESSDHGPFNSWDRQVYVFDGDDGQPTTVKRLDHIERNMFIANYHSDEAVDNDDGSCFYDTTNNFFYLGKHGMKSDFGGHSNHHAGNVYAYVSQTPFCNGYNGNMAQMLDGYEDSFYNNTAVMLFDGDYAKPVCAGEGKTLSGGNTVFAPTGNITECGMSVAAWQAQGNDPGTVVMGRLPTDAELLAAGRAALGLP